MSGISLVTGANGHLGNNLVRYLLKKGRKVRAGIRNPEYQSLFSNSDCEVVRADLHDKQSLLNAMQDVETLFQVAAVYQHWARNADKEILSSNLKSTQNVMEAAAEAGVSKIVYVSSMAAIDYTKAPLNESTWNTDLSNPYYRSKIESEQLAWTLAYNYNIWMVSVLPTVIIGPNCNGRYTPSMEVLWSVLHNKYPFDPRFHFNYIDVRDVAEGMVLALEKGKNGERYLLANQNQTTSTQLFDLARTHYPKTKKPLQAPKTVLYLAATAGEFMSKVTGQKPPLLKSWVKLYHRVDYQCDISKARQELGFNPSPPDAALAEALNYIMKSENLNA